MVIDKYVEQNFAIRCNGRDVNGNEVLTKSVEVELRIYQSQGSSTISCSNNCPYNLGEHWQNCKALNKEELRGGICPYSFDIPHAIDLISKITPL